MSEILAGLQLYPCLPHDTQPTHTQSHIQVYVNSISLLLLSEGPAPSQLTVHLTEPHMCLCLRPPVSSSANISSCQTGVSVIDPLLDEVFHGAVLDKTVGHTKP